MSKRFLAAAILVIAGALFMAADGKYREAAPVDSFDVITDSGATDSTRGADTSTTFSIKGYNSLQYSLALDGDTSTALGIGLADSASIYVQVLFGSAWTSIDSAFGPIPLTLSHQWPASQDSVIGTAARAVVAVIDTTTDTTVTISYTLTAWWYCK